MEIFALVVGFALGQVGALVAWILGQKSDRLRHERELMHEQAIWRREQMLSAAKQYDEHALELLDLVRRRPGLPQEEVDLRLRNLGAELSTMLLFAPDHVQFLAAQLHASLRDVWVNLHSADEDERAEGEAAVGTCLQLSRNFVLAVRGELVGLNGPPSDAEMLLDPYARFRTAMPS